MHFTQFLANHNVRLHAISAINTVSRILLILGLLCSTIHLAQAAPSPVHGLNNPNRIKGQFIVVLKASTLSARAASENAQAMAVSKGFYIKHQFNTAINGFTMYSDADQANNYAALNSLTNNPDVAFIEADQYVEIEQISTNGSGIQSNLTFSEWGLDRVDQRSLPLDHSFTPRASGLNVHVYVLDSGINASHEEFLGRIGNGISFIEDGNGTNDCKGHGTHVAGTIAGTHFGVAKKATVHSVRVLDCMASGSLSGILAGIDWTIQNHKKPALINMSLGFGGIVESMDLAVENAVAAGITVVVAAGNNNSLACDTSPARATKAITVGASDSTDRRTFFSNTGSCVDVFAPGLDITSASIPGQQTISSLSGTSMAAPHVAGVAALFLEKNPTAGPQQVTSAVINGATKDILVDVGAGSPNLLVNIENTLPSTTPTNWKRTVVFIESKTQSGQDLFILGGIDHGFAKSNLNLDCGQTKSLCSIPIRHLNMRNATTAPWKINDTLLDWGGAEPGQNTAAKGSPLDWTTWLNSTTFFTYDVHGFGKSSLNLWGDHYWMLEVQMDCSRTVNGWFELKSFVANGSGWENNVTQPGAPYLSGNHFAQCGKLSVFKRGQSNPVTISSL